MPSRNTFTIEPFRQAIKSVLKDAAVVVDPFANNSRYGTIRNDLNPEFDTDYHLDALEFLKTLESDSADAVLFDPPYSITQAAECYKSYGKEKLEVNVANMSYWSQCKDHIARILKPGGSALFRLEFKRRRKMPRNGNGADNPRRPRRSKERHYLHY